MGLGALYGASGVERGMRERILERLRIEQAQQQMDLATRGADRADVSLQAQLEANDLSRQTLADNQRYTREKDQIDQGLRVNEATPAGFLPTGSPIVGMLRKLDAVSPVEARPEITDGPLQPGDARPAHEAGFMKHETALQQRSRLDDERADASSRSLAASRGEGDIKETPQGFVRIRPDGSVEPIADAGGKQVQAYHPPKDPKEASITNVLGLVREGEKVRAPLREMQRALTVMHAGLEQAKKGNLNAGSQQILVTFQKILDPTSVVRESEYARSGEGQAFLSRIEGFTQRIAQGGPGMTIPELQQFVSAAEAMMGSLETHGNSKRQQLESIAKKYGIDPSLVWDDGGAGSAIDVGGAGGGTEEVWGRDANGKPVRIK